MIIGVDEVGYGAWAGPLYICRLKFLQKPDFKLFDSKKISPKKREELFNLIHNISEYKIGIAPVEDINLLGLAKAYKVTLLKLLNELKEDIFIDGRKPSYLNCTAIIKGDSLVDEISAASIIAKVSRDRYMESMASQFPVYNFEKNKGYGTKFHQEALKIYGFCSIHRVNYKLKKYITP